MIKTILAPLSGFDSDQILLDAAVAIAKICDAHIDCLHTRIDTAEAAAWADVTTIGYDNGLQRMAQEIVQNEIARAEHARLEFENTCRRHSLTISNDPGTAVGTSIAWEDVKAGANETLRRTRYHDLVVLARAAECSTLWIEKVLMQAGRPILLASSKPAETIGRRVAIAWKPGSEAARALTAASSILSSADRVTILAVSEDAAKQDADHDSAEYLAQQLRWHGIQAELRIGTARLGLASETLKQMAHNCDADLLVMGAYGHSRLREWVFGGATADVLADCVIPVLMFH